MATKKKTETAKVPAEDLSSLELHEKLTVNGWDVLRVPGGFIYNRGAASAFVPLNELSAGEAGIELVPA